MLGILIIMLQGALMGYITGQVYDTSTFEFWLIIITNAVCMVAYGTIRKYEK